MNYIWNMVWKNQVEDNFVIVIARIISDYIL